MTKYFDEEGNPVEFDPERVKTLEEELASKSTLEADLKAKEEEMAKLQEEVNPNWKEARRTMDNLKEAVRKTGAVLNDDGTIKEDQVIISKDEITKQAQDSAKEFILKQKIEDELAKVPEDKREVVRAYFNKLSTGEDLSTENISKFIQEAKIVSGGGQINNDKEVFFNRGGGSFEAPKTSDNTFDKSEEGQALASQFGLTYLKDERK